MSIITLASVQVLRSLVGGVLTLRVRLCSPLTLEGHQTPPGEQHQQHAGALQQPHWDVCQIVFFDSSFFSNVALTRVAATSPKRAYVPKIW